MADVAQAPVMDEAQVNNLKDLITQMREDLLDFARCINEDAHTSNKYLTHILGMLSTGESQIPILPIITEVTNLNNQRTEYWLKRDQKLKSTLSNFEKISQIFDDFILQNSQKDV